MRKEHEHVVTADQAAKTLAAVCALRRASKPLAAVVELFFDALAKAEGGPGALPERITIVARPREKLLKLTVAFRAGDAGGETAKEGSET